MTLSSKNICLRRILGHQQGGGALVPIRLAASQMVSERECVSVDGKAYAEGMKKRKNRQAGRQADQKHP